jgi:hypothetical protein
MITKGVLRMHNTSIHHLIVNLVSAALIGISSAAVADSYGDPINVQISNQTETDRPVTVIDNVCNERVLDGRIEAGSWVAVQLCTIAMQGGDATVRDNLSGNEKRYQSVGDSDELVVP